jgi:hypothetical protein
VRALGAPARPRLREAGDARLKLLVDLFLAAYALDAALSPLDDALRHGFGASWLAPARGLVAQAVAWACLAVYLALGLFPRLPARVLLPPAAFILWHWLGAVPLALLLPAPAPRALALNAAQLLLAALALAFWRPLRRAPAPPAAPVFRLRHTLGFALVHALLLPPGLVVWAALGTAQALELETRGFVSFGVSGMSLVERRYRRDEQEVVLAGMVHVGEASAYRDLYASFVEESTVVLQEGVTDREGRLDVHFSYEPLASAVGLGAQPDVGEVLAQLRERAGEGEPVWPQLRHADIDVAEFSPLTLELLRRIDRVFGAEDLRAELRDFARFVRASDPELREAFQADVIERRNQHLLAELAEALEAYRRVVVPWGALHLPAVEEALLEMGFERAAERRRLAVAWTTLGDGLLRLARALVS